MTRLDEKQPDVRPAAAIRQMSRFAPVFPPQTPFGPARGLRDLAVLGATLLVVADDGVHGEELWTSDGTAAGTRMVADLAGEDEAILPWSLAVVGGELYFAPDTLTDHDLVEYFEGTVRVAYRLLPTADVHVGYRFLILDCKR